MGQLQDNSETRNKIKAEIEKLETANGLTAQKQTLPTVKLDEVSYTAPSDEYLKLAAENSLAEYRKNGENAIRDDSAATAKSLADQKSVYEQNRASDEKALAAGYEKSATAIDNDAIKRGLARSSVAAVNRGELEKEYLAQSAELNGAYGKKISELEAEISALDGKMREALGDFNLSYATRLGDKIAELKNERDEKIMKVTEFNNTVRKNQATIDADKAKTESSLYSAALNQAEKQKTIPPDKLDEVYKSVYDVMDGYLGAMDPIEAKRELLNHSLYREHLSNYYYTKLLDKYGRDN